MKSDESHKNNSLSWVGYKVDYYISLIFNKIIKKNIYFRIGRLFLMSTVAAASGFNLLEFFLKEVFEKNNDSNELQITILLFFLLGISVVFFVLSVFEDKKSKKTNELSGFKKIIPVKKINNFQIFVYEGDIRQIREVDVIVTSENSDLNLGSLSGTSMSGRVRKMAALIDDKGDLIEDGLNDSLQNWKKRNGKFSNFPLGMILEMPPMEAASLGVKKIVLSVAVQKDDALGYLYNDGAICKIIMQSIKLTSDSNLKSVFIPIFGIGSANIDKDRAIKAVINSLKNCDMIAEGVLIYLGVYRSEDAANLITFINNS